MKPLLPPLTLKGALEIVAASPSFAPLPVVCPVCYRQVERPCGRSFGPGYVCALQAGHPGQEERDHCGACEGCAPRLLELARDLFTVPRAPCSRCGRPTVFPVGTHAFHVRCPT